MNLDLALSEDELEELDEFLGSDAMLEEGMDISALDGFLAAMVLNPQLIPPSQWLPWIWDMDNGEKSPAFADSQQANRVIGFLLRHYNMVSDAIEGGRFDPLLMELAQEDGSEFYDAEGWCQGFMLGVSVFPDRWRTVLKEHTELVAPMVLLGTERGWKILEEGGPDANKRRTQEAYEAIPGAVAALHEHFRLDREKAVDSSPGVSMGAQPLRRAAPKVGRNDPCPCGSGKKFKKCCGANEALD